MFQKWFLFMSRVNYTSYSLDLDLLCVLLASLGSLGGQGSHFSDISHKFALIRWWEYSLRIFDNFSAVIRVTWFLLAARNWHASKRWGRSWSHYFCASWSRDWCWAMPIRQWEINQCNAGNQSPRWPCAPQCMLWSLVSKATRDISCRRVFHSI